MAVRVIMVLVTAALAGCFTNLHRRSQRILVVTEPDSANVWVVDNQGHRTMGRSPTTVITSYEVEETDFLDACWVAPGLLGVGAGAGIIGGITSRDSDDDLAFTIIGITYSFMTLAALGGCLAGKELEGEEPLYQTVSIGASIPGRADSNALVQVPGPDGLEVRLYLPPAR